MKNDLDLNELYPAVECPIKPLDERITVQIQPPRTKKGSILLASDTQESEKWAQQTAKVVAVGENAFKNRNGLVLPGERKPTFKIGDFVRIPLHGGDKVEVSHGTNGDTALFITCKWYEVIGVIQVDPRLIKVTV